MALDLASGGPGCAVDDDRFATRLQLLDGFELRANHQPVPTPQPAQRVLALLAVAGRPLQREYVAATLWTGTDRQRAAANLRSALWRLRAVPDLVLADRTHLRIGADVQFDVREMELLADRLLIADAGTGLPARVRSQPGVSIRILDRDLLPDWSEGWADLERERLRQLRIGALEQLSRLWRDLGRFTLAVDAALTAIRAEPLREAAHLELIRSHLEAGNRGEALHCYHRLCSLLEEELGLLPSPRLRTLVANGVAAGQGATPGRWPRSVSPSGEAPARVARPAEPTARSRPAGWRRSRR